MASSLNPPTPDINEVQKNFNQTATTWIIISVISSLVGLGIIGFIAYKCTKNGRKVIVEDLPIVIAAYNRPHNTNAVPVWEVTAPTLENFLQEMARDKLVRFTAQQLSSFTNNYSTRLGSGGFGAVYKGSVSKWSKDCRQGSY
ncbi:G-type lectin S-receptor-like serine/threonine-protein kinase SD2-5 [Pistacia vera]|uniref:G-type lectin S-receptor-like serine/threonine-protein kinase SD2-5 n=1 Tax=Pistacia vera TaxID=55513 RepID=UPI00126337FB|nr:G-type lectin S-receptor-like serine/threonine-protein kinase SD2-5 [Pistacia vera]XP_031276348.1 G-type lectin S-receptor-like serine/threonine-protein kinase SD2-5 [Pistacia vera]